MEEIQSEKEAPPFEAIDKIVEENTDFTIVENDEDMIKIQKEVQCGSDAFGMVVTINPQLYAMNFNDDEDDFDDELFGEEENEEEEDDEDDGDEYDEDADSEVSEEINFTVSLSNAAGKEIHLDCYATRDAGSHDMTVQNLYMQDDFGYSPDMRARSTLNSASPCLAFLKKRASLIIWGSLRSLLVKSRSMTTT